MNQEEARKLLSAALNGGPLPAQNAESWQALTQAAVREGVAPLWYWNASRHGTLPALPLKAQAELRTAYAQSWKANQILLLELESLAAELKRAHLPAVLLKGANFALRLYPDLGARPMSDLDLLVPFAQIEQAVEIAKKLGFEDSAPEAAPHLNQLLGHAVWMYAPQRRAALEIHYTLAASAAFKYAAPLNWFWGQTQPLAHPRYAALLTFSPQGNLLYAAAHAMLQHGGKSAPLRWFVDMDLLLRKYEHEINWQNLLEEAQRIAWISALRAGLEQTQRYFASPIPPEAQEQLRHAADSNSPLVKALRRQPLSHTEEEIQKWKTLRLNGKIQMARALVFPSAEYMRRRYQLTGKESLAPSYLMRWAGILRDILHTLARRLYKFVKKMAG